MNKKADLNVLQITIISILVIAIMIVPGKLYADYISESSKINVCQTSLFKAGFQKEVTFDVLQSSLECNDLPDVVVKESEVTRDGKINDDAVKKQVADSMLRCWKMVGRGEVDPYKKFDNEQSYCFVCSDVTFDADFKDAAKNQDYKFNGLLYWIAANNVQDLKTSYYEELYSFKPEDNTILAIKQQIKDEKPIDINQQYSIVWKMEADKLSALSAGSIFTGAAGTGAVAGAKLGAIAGTFIPVLGQIGIGQLVGAVAGGIGGAGAGAFGSWFFVKTLTNGDVVSTQILFIPKSLLSQDIEANGKKKPFCTKLVNF